MEIPCEWHEIFEHNNKPAIFAVTGKKIIDPDLIFIGQKLYIPPGSPKTHNPPHPRTPGAKPLPLQGKSGAKRKLRSMPIEYKLDKLPPITVVSQTHIATIRIRGTITLQSRKTMDFVMLDQNGMEISAKREADYALGKLVTDTRIGFDQSSGKVTFECGITSHSNSANSLSTKLSTGLSSNTGLPVLKGTIITPPINGYVSDHFYLTNKLNIDIEITPRPPSAKPKPEHVPNQQSVPEGRSGWDYLIGTGLIIGAGVIVIGTIVEDIITGGVGIADDVPSFATAAAMCTSGILMFKKVQGGIPIPIEGYGIAQDQF